MRKIILLGILSVACLIAISVKVCNHHAQMLAGSDTISSGNYLLA